MADVTPAGGADQRRTVLFVCAHGAGKSRVAAAWFDALAPGGWRATTAGLEPEAAVSVHAVALLDDTAAAATLDHEPPRPVSAAGAVDVVVGIDCRPEVDGVATQEWTLAHRRGDEMSAELRERVSRLLASVVRD